MDTTAEPQLQQQQQQLQHAEEDQKQQQEQQLRILVKCGGFSSQLEKHVGRIDGDPLWGSRYDAKNPTAVVQTHLDFLQNGAQIILSNTYQSSVEGFMKHLNLSKEASIQLIHRSVQLTKDARNKYKKMVEAENGILEPGLPLVLASIGPYGAHLHDGSEYDGNYAERISKEELQNWHRVRIDACLAEGVDGLAVETIPCQLEAEAVVEMLLKDYTGVKFWVSFQCKDKESLAHGEPFGPAVLSIWQLIITAKATERLMGIGINCTNPNLVTSLFTSVHVHCQAADLPVPPLVVYSNRGETFDAELYDWTGAEKCIPLETYVPEWIKLGAKIIGGCCRVYPADILQIRKCIDNLDNNN